MPGASSYATYSGGFDVEVRCHLCTCVAVIKDYEVEAYVLSLFEWEYKNNQWFCEKCKKDANMYQRFN